MERTGTSHLTTASAIQVFYDDQCEICQACVSWLRVLDRRKRAGCIGTERARILASPSQLPLVRRWMIGQPPPLTHPFMIPDDRLPTASGHLEVIAVD